MPRSDEDRDTSPKADEVAQARQVVARARQEIARTKEAVARLAEQSGVPTASGYYYGRSPRPASAPEGEASPTQQDRRRRPGQA